MLSPGAKHLLGGKRPHFAFNNIQWRIAHHHSVGCHHN